MLGADGPRTYAVLFLNNAEVRATGGIAGSWAIVQVEHGSVAIVKQGSAGDVNSHLSGVPVPVPSDVAALYTNRPGTFFQDVDMSPSFPTDAALASAMFQQAYGIQVDGVISTDPVALAGLLKATGPVKLPLGGSLTASNAVSLLLSQVYANIQNPAQEDAYFAQAANAVFAALSAGQGDARATVKALADAARAGRLTVWSRHPAEEKLLAGTALEGAMPSERACRRPDRRCVSERRNRRQARLLPAPRRHGRASCLVSGRTDRVSRAGHSQVDRSCRCGGPAGVREGRRVGGHDSIAGGVRCADRRLDRFGIDRWRTHFDR